MIPYSKCLVYFNEASYSNEKLQLSMIQLNDINIKYY